MKTTNEPLDILQAPEASARDASGRPKAWWTAIAGAMGGGGNNTGGANSGGGGGMNFGHEEIGAVAMQWLFPNAAMDQAEAQALVYGAQADVYNAQAAAASAAGAQKVKLVVDIIAGLAVVGFIIYLIRR